MVHIASFRVRPVEGVRDPEPCGLVGRVWYTALVHGVGTQRRAAAIRIKGLGKGGVVHAISLRLRQSLVGRPGFFGRLVTTGINEPGSPAQRRGTGWSIGPWPDNLPPRICRLARFALTEPEVRLWLELRHRAVSPGSVAIILYEGHDGALRNATEGRSGHMQRRRSMRIFNPVPFVAVAAAVALAAGPAMAHASLVSATPAPDSTVASPRSLSLTFSERMVPAFSTFDVVNSAGIKVAVSTSVAEDGKTIAGTLARPLAAGAYRVDWRIASGDGHRMTGSYNFSVR